MRTGAVPHLQARSGDAPAHAVACARRLLDRRTGPKTLAILCVNSTEANAVAQGLRETGADFFYVTDKQKPRNRSLVGSADQPVVLSTIHSAKGLEFPSVIVCCTARQGMAIEELRNVLYVGMMRATERLVVVVDRRHPLLPDLQRAAESTARIALDGSIEES